VMVFIRYPSVSFSGELAKLPADAHLLV